MEDAAVPESRGQQAAVAMQSDAPAMPTVSASTLWRRSPYHFAGGKRHGIGWQNTRGTPCFVVTRASAMATIKVLHRFPLTEDGWGRAWAALAKLDGDAARAVVEQVTAVAARERATAVLAELDAATVVLLPQVIFLGGYVCDTELCPGQTYELRFLDDKILMMPSRLGNPLVGIPYSDIETVEIGGPGLVKSGGGFIGGGSGIAGAAEGMAVATILNGLTSRTSIKTIVRVQATICELFMLHTSLAPEQLRIELSRPLAAIRSAPHDGTLAVRQGGGKVSPLEDLAKLASMLESGLLTRDEFDQLKAKFFANL